MLEAIATVLRREIVMATITELHLDTGLDLQLGMLWKSRILRLLIGVTGYGLCS